MIAVEDTVLVLLAAGRSERFGDVGSKLDQPFLFQEGDSGLEGGYINDKLLHSISAL